MKTSRLSDVRHKMWMSRVLTAIADDTFLSSTLAFKGGTCAAMLNHIERFSVDLDFDMRGNLEDVQPVRDALEMVFEELGLKVDKKSENGIQYFLKYLSPLNERSTIKLDTQYPPPNENIYEENYFADIDRTLQTQNLETMVANKMVAVLNRWETHKSFAGRDIFDVHTFFQKGFRYNKAVIQERTGLTVLNFLNKLVLHIQEHCTQKVLQQDLNPLLPATQFKAVYKNLKQETIIFLQDEAARQS